MVNDTLSPVDSIHTNAPSKKHRQAKSHYTVDNLELLYKLADAKLLHKLHGVNDYAGGKRLWFFKKCEDVNKVIKAYEAEKTNQTDNTVSV